jgi:hypothetical protein
MANRLRDAASCRHADRDVSTRRQVADAAVELHKLIDRVEREALDSLEHPTVERLAAFDGHRRLIDTALMILRRTVARRIDREQSRTEDEEADSEKTGPHVPVTKRPTTRPLK